MKNKYAIPYVNALEQWTKKNEKYKKSTKFKKYQAELLAWKIHETKKPYPEEGSAPKRPLGAFIRYSNDIRNKVAKKNPDENPAALMKIIGDMWNSLDDKGRKKWVDQVIKDKERYKKQLNRYLKSETYQNWVKERDNYKATMLAKRNKLMGIRATRKRKLEKDRDSSATPKGSRARFMRTPSKTRSRTRASSLSRTPKRRRRSRTRSRTTSRVRSRSVTSRSLSHRPRRRSIRRRARSRTPKAPRRSRTRSKSRRRTRRASRRKLTAKRRRRSSTSRSKSVSKSRSRSRKRSRRAKSVSKGESESDWLDRCPLPGC